MLHAARHAGIFRLALFGAALAGFVLALVLAASPELHEQWHDCADHHECLATTLTVGACADTSPPPTLASFVATLFEAAPPDGSRAVGSFFLSGCIFEHAPPILS